MAATVIPPLEQEKHELQAMLDAHVQRMLQSQHFARAETQRRLLAYLWEHRHENVNEYAIATEALGRNGSFDPTVDASVRVHISRLRRKLKDYYQHEASEPELLVIPTGTHHLIVVDVLANPEDSAPEPVRQAIAAQPDSPRGRRYLVPVLSSFCALLVVAIGVLLWTVVGLRQKQQPHARPLPNAFWTSFLSGNAPIKIILPTPVFFGFPNAPSIRMRSTKVNNFHELMTDPKLAELARNLGKPTFEQSYTVTSDTLAAIEMARYLDSVGAKERISFEVTRDSSMVVLEQSNVIAVGTHQTLEPLHDYLQAMNFSLAPGETRVVNANPAPGENRTYEVINESPKDVSERMIRPSIISLLPGRAPGLKLLMLQSRDTGAMISLLSTSAGSNSVEAFLKKHGSPQFFEMVVETELENNRPLRSWPVAIHAFSSQAPPSNSM